MILDNIRGKEEAPTDNIFLRGLLKENVDWIKHEAKSRQLTCKDFMDALITEVRKSNGGAKRKSPASTRRISKRTSPRS
jgi:hypothetical protein